MFRASLIAASPALAFLPSMAFAQASNVDLNRFGGRWFEIERNHNTVQKDCSGRRSTSPRATPPTSTPSP